MAETTQSVLVTRSELLSYMNVGTTESPSWKLIGEGFTTFTESKNPQEYERHYVHEKSSRTDVVGYAPAIEYSTDFYTNNEVIAKIMKITDEELIGSDAQVEICHVHTWDVKSAATDSTPATCGALFRKYAVIPDAKGDGTEALIYSGNLKAVGDVVKGTFNGTTFEKATETT